MLYIKNIKVDELVKRSLEVYNAGDRTFYDAIKVNDYQNSI